MQVEYELGILKRLAKIQVEKEELRAENQHLKATIDTLKKAGLVTFISDFQEATTR